MKLFLDTANVEDIKKYASWGLVDGVTTNPSLIAKEGVSFKDRILEITKVIKGPISAEVTAEDVETMVRQGKEFATWAQNIYVKCPMTPNGLIACQTLSKEGVRVNMTLVFSAAQALLCAKAGAAFVSPFIGRIDDMGQSGMLLVEEIVQIYQNYNFETEVLVASIRSPRQITDSAIIGADICTVPAAIYDKLVKHPLTDTGLKKFAEDAKKFE